MRRIKGHKGATRRLDTCERTAIVEAFDTCGTVRGAAKRSGVDIATARKVLRQAGRITPHVPSVPADVVAAVITAYPEAPSVKAAAKADGAPLATAREIISAAGLTRPPRHHPEILVADLHLGRADEVSGASGPAAFASEGAAEPGAAGTARAEVDPASAPPGACFSAFDRSIVEAYRRYRSIDMTVSVTGASRRHVRRVAKEAGILEPPGSNSAKRAATYGAGLPPDAVAPPGFDEAAAAAARERARQVDEHLADLCRVYGDPSTCPSLRPVELRRERSDQNLHAITRPADVTALIFNDPPVGTLPAATIVLPRFPGITLAARA